MKKFVLSFIAFFVLISSVFSKTLILSHHANGSLGPVTMRGDSLKFFNSNKDKLSPGDVIAIQNLVITDQIGSGVYMTDRFNEKSGRRNFFLHQEQRMQSKIEEYYEGLIDKCSFTGAKVTAYFRNSGYTIHLVGIEVPYD